MRRMTFTVEFEREEGSPCGPGEIAEAFMEQIEGDLKFDVEARDRPREVGDVSVYRVAKMEAEW